MPADASHTDVSQEDDLLVEAVSLLVRRQRETETWVSEHLDQADERAAASERRYAALETRLAGIEDQLARLVREFGPAASGAPEDERLASLRDQLEALKSDTNGRAARGEGASTAPVPISRAAEAPNGPPAPRPAEARVAEPPLPSRAVGSRAPEVTSGTSSTPAGVSRATDAPSRGASTEALAPRAAELPSRTLSAPRPTPAGATEVTGASAAATPPDGDTVVARRSTSWLDLLGDTPQDRFGLILIGVGLIALLYAILTQLHIG